MQHEPAIFFHLKLVAKISLVAGVAAVLCLLVALSFLTGPAGESYEAIIRNNSITRHQLGPLMLLSGLVLVALVAILTWVIALYSSFRIAGPLYRFSQTLLSATSSKKFPVSGLRSGDALKVQEHRIREALASLAAHDQAIDRLARQAEKALDTNDAEAYAEAVRQLRKLDEQARL